MCKINVWKIENKPCSCILDQLDGSDATHGKSCQVRVAVDQSLDDRGLKKHLSGLHNETKADAPTPNQHFCEDQI